MQDSVLLTMIWLEYWGCLERERVSLQVPTLRWTEGKTDGGEKEGRKDFLSRPQIVDRLRSTTPLLSFLLSLLISCSKVSVVGRCLSVVPLGHMFIPSMEGMCVCVCVYRFYNHYRYYVPLPPLLSLPSFLILPLPLLVLQLPPAAIH